jgi:hypothetical protein
MEKNIKSEIQIISISGKKRHGKNTLADYMSAILFDLHEPTYFKSSIRKNDLSNFLDNSNAFHTPQSFVDEHGLILPKKTTFQWENKSFAYKVKLVASVVLNKSIEEVDSDKFKDSYLPNWEMTGRTFLQKLGTNAMRFGLHNDIWVKSLFEEFNRKSKWIITDTRFLNEINEINKHNSLKIVVFRPNILQVSFNKDMSDTFSVININRNENVWTLKHNSSNLVTFSNPKNFFLKSDDNHESETSLDNYSEFDEIIINESKDSLFKEAERIISKYNLHITQEKKPI